MNPYRTWTDHADRATKLALKAELLSALHDLALNIVDRLRAEGVGDEFAWGCADTAHRAMASALIARGGRVSDTFERLAIVNLALDQLPAVLRQWLPDGEKRGFSYIGPTPSGSGSVTVDLVSGAWSEQALGIGGADPISLAAHLFNITEAEAARRILAMLKEPS